MTAGRITRRSALGAGLALAAAGPARAADTLRIGLLHTLSPAPLYIAMQRGWFAAEGLDASFRFFEAAQPIAAAAVAGDIDVGITALTGGFFSLAGRGTLKVIAGALHEQAGFEGNAILASNQAYAAGLTSAAKLGGHSMGITQYGASFHYITGRLAETQGFDLKSVTLRPLQGIGNMLAAVRTGQVDATMAVASQAKPLAAAGEAHIIGWAGELVPYQLTAVFAPTRMLDARADAVRAFMRAYVRGVAAYREAFLRRGTDGAPVRDATTQAAIRDILAYVFTGDPQGPAKVLDGVGYYDEGAALDVADVSEQLRWFLSQGLVRGPIAPDEVIDTRFAAVRTP